MEKRNWDPKSGSGWGKGTDGYWYQYKNFEKTGRKQKYVIFRNPLKGIEHEAKKLKKLYIKNQEEYKKRYQAKIDAGYVLVRGRWKKKKNYGNKDKVEVKENNNNNLKVNKEETNNNESKTNKTVVKEETNNNGNNKENKNENKTKNNNENKTKTNNNEVKTTNNNGNNKENKTVNNEVKTNDNLKVKPKYFTFKGKRYRANSVGARKAENILKAKQRAKDMAKKRLGIL